MSVEAEVDPVLQAAEMLATEKDVVRVIDPPDLLPEHFAANPFVPLRKAPPGRSTNAVELSHLRVEDLQPDAYVKQDLPVALAVTLYLVLNAGRSGTDTLKTGLRRLCDYHAERRWSELTLAHIQQDLHKIEEACREKNARRLKVANNFEDEHVRNRRLQAVQHSVASNGAGAVRNYKDAIVSLHRFLNGLTRLQTPSPLEGIHTGPDISGWQRGALTEEQMDRLWSAAACERDSELALLILDLMRETACRCASVGSFNLEDINWHEGTVILRTKGDRVHSTVVSRDLLERIAARAERQGWDGVRPSQYNSFSKTGARSGTPALRQSNGKRLSRKNINDLFSRCDERAGHLDDAKVTAHMLRHTTITQVERIAGEEAAARWAGHRRGPKSKADQTAVYVKWMLEERIAILNYMFPSVPHGPYVPDVIARQNAGS